MIELKNNQLVFRFPEVHRKAVGRIDFIKTLRIPDDGRHYPLPAGIGRFHLEHLEDHAERVPAHWLKRGGALLPMYQSEALWINFTGGYPMAIKIATGKINAVTGETWTNTLSSDPQDYVVLPEQPWLDGYAIERGTVRQFVATQLGRGETAEEQITGKAEFGGIQIIAFPMKAEVYKEHFERPRDQDFECLDMPMFCRSAPDSAAEMGIAPGGRIKQEIYDDEYGLEAWDLSAGTRCFLHTVNSEHWEALTGLAMPDRPITAKRYKEAGIPWFEYYAEDKKPLPGSKLLKSLKSLGQKSEPATAVEIGEPITLEPIIALSLQGRVSDGEF
tara:strand:- start:11771 stop:12763 length:993 start_codon:yes stop_codon:yes gene_type:complete